MYKFAENVVDFNEKILGIPKRDRALLEEAELDITVKCLHEEIGELMNAHDNQDYIGAIDAVVDLMYFAIGSLYKMGLTVHEMEKIGQIVHYCNMKKKPGIVLRRGDGSAADAVKSDEWIGPEQQIAKLLGGEL